jgi:hypothetical protein
MSLQHVPYSQHHARLSLVPEAPSPQPGHTIERRPVRQQDDNQQMSETLSTRTNSDTNLYAPIRRRSLLQHGVATRNSWADNDSRTSLSTQFHSQTDLRNYYYDPNRPTSSPLSTLANMEIPMHSETIPGPRVATPDDLDYGHIGVYKLGSLRITNGDASLAPSVEKLGATGGDSISAKEDGRSAQGHRHGLSHRNNTASVPPGVIKPPWITRAESPLRQEYNEVEKYEALTIDTHLPLPEFSLFKFTDGESPTKSLDLAKDYMNELALSPFSFENSPPTSPRLEATSKHMAVEDDLFEPEPGTPEISEFRSRKSFDSGYPVETPSTQQSKKSKAPRDAPKPLAKADSGYSSNVSLRSFKSNLPPSVPAKEAPPTPPKPVRVPSSTYSIASTPSIKSDVTTIRTKRSLPALPVEREIVMDSHNQAPPVSLKYESVHNAGSPPPPQKSPEQTWAAAQGRPNVITKPQHRHARSQSIPSAGVTTPEPGQQTQSLPASEVSSSTASTSRWSRTRSRPRPQTLPATPAPYTVQALPPPGSSSQLHIPPVPAAISLALHQRVDAFPVSCFLNTPGPRRTPSKETLGTIFSVGSAEWREELTYMRLQSSLPPVPAPIPEHAPKPAPNRRHTFNPTTRKPLRHSLQPAPNPALQSKLQRDFEEQITSHTSIASSIGRSPYDIALASSSSSSAARAKSMTAQLEADAAVKYARASKGAGGIQELQRAISWDSLATNGQEFQNQGQSQSQHYANPNPQPHTNAHTSSRQPPSAHSNRPQSYTRKPLPTHRSQPNLHTHTLQAQFQAHPQFQSHNPKLQLQRNEAFVRDEASRVSMPPVSMTTQHAQPQAKRKSLPAMPRRSAPGVPVQNGEWGRERAGGEGRDPEAVQSEFWGSRSVDAQTQAQAQARKSVEARRSIETQNRPTFDNPMQRPASACPALSSALSHPHPQQTSDPRTHPNTHQNQQQPPKRQVLSHRAGFDTRHVSNPSSHRQVSGGSWTSRVTSEFASEWEERDGDTKYDCTYGSDGHGAGNGGGWDKENQGHGDRGNYLSQAHAKAEAQAQRGEYYDAPQDTQDPDPRSLTRATTGEMLVLDQYAGALGWDVGLGRSEGMGAKGNRRGGEKSGSVGGVREGYGVNFSNVPIFLRGVGVRG